MEYLTEEGFKKIKEKLEYLRNVKRREIAKRLAAAIELGDLIENAEYSSAKEEQGLIEAEIRRLENLVKTAMIVKDDHKKTGVWPGQKVIVEIDGERKELWLVGSEEADPLKGRISVDSPIGRALLGKKVNEKGEIKLPKGKKKFKIIDII